MWRLRLKVAITNEVPCPETDRSWSIPSTVLTTSSMRCETSASTSSGAAPGRFVRTLTVGRSTEGKRSTPNLKKPAAPTTTSDRTIMVANTGRRIHISASFCILKEVFGFWSLRPLIYHLNILPGLQISGLEDYFLSNVYSGHDFREFST